MQDNTNKHKAILLLFIFSAIIAFLIFRDDGFMYDFNVLLSSFLISELALIRIFIFSKYPFSLNNIVHLFFLFFFGIAPAIQFKQSISFWDPSNYLTINDYVFINYILLILLVIYNLSYEFYIKTKMSNLSCSTLKIIHTKKNNRLYFLVILSILAFLIFSSSKNFNILAILFRGGFTDITYDNNSTNSVLSLIINIFVRPIPVVCLIIYKQFGKQNNKFTFLELFLIFITLISNSPLGMPRFQAAALYIPLFLIYFNLLRKPLNFTLFFCFSLLVIFPFLDQFRQLDNSLQGLTINTEMFEQGHFDAYQNTANVIINNEITYGEQLLGVVFFYVPRGIWPDKPIGSGAYIADKFEYGFSNISMSFMGEGFINFGYFGLFLFTILLGVFNAQTDYNYWIFKTKNSYLNLFYLMLLGMQFFILRGDLLSSFAYTMGLFLSLVLVYIIVIKEN